MCENSVHFSSPNFRLVPPHFVALRRYCVGFGVMLLIVEKMSVYFDFFRRKMFDGRQCVFRQIPLRQAITDLTQDKPDYVPTSDFTGKHGYVRYSIKATLVKPWKINKSTKVAISVLDLVDLNRTTNLNVRFNCHYFKIIWPSGNMSAIIGCSTAQCTLHMQCLLSQYWNGRCSPRVFLCFYSAIFD